MMTTKEEGRELLPVFIYGTLKKGYPNSHYMPVSAVYMGNACTVDAWPLVVDTDMGIPYLLRIQDHPNAQKVEGELYKVDEAAVRFLDNFEGLDTGFYIRERLKVCSPAFVQNDGSRQQSSTAVSPNEIIDATAYFRSPANGGPVSARKWTVATLLTLPMVLNTMDILVSLYEGNRRYIDLMDLQSFDQYMHMQV